MADQLEEGLSSLPRELFFDIFSRFSVKTLCRLRAVSKKWLLLTAAAEFTANYFHKHKLNPSLLFTKTHPSRINLLSYYIDGTLQSSFDTELDGELISILTCRGIVCLVCSSKIFLCDPITQISSSLSCPNLRSTISIAFGYAPIRNEFKIVHFYEVEKFDNYHYGAVKETVCEILCRKRRNLWSDNSSSSIEWRKLARKFEFDVSRRKSSVCVSGWIYWLIAEKRFNPESLRILSFDVDWEQFGVVCFPRIYSNRSVECVGLLEVRGRLCLTDRLPWESTMAIWMLEDRHESSWSKKYSINLLRIHHGGGDFKIMGYIPPSRGHCEGQILIKVGTHRALCYDIQKRNFQSLDVEADDVNVEGQELQLLVNRNCLF